MAAIDYCNGGGVNTKKLMAFEKMVASSHPASPGCYHAEWRMSDSTLEAGAKLDISSAHVNELHLHHGAVMSFGVPPAIGAFHCNNTNSNYRQLGEKKNGSDKKDDVDDGEKQYKKDDDDE
eukprot:4128283-Pleurochrysis_carterae.AAC.1